MTATIELDRSRFEATLEQTPRPRAGTIWTNTYMDGTSELRFGGFRQSGLGRELGRNAVSDYTKEKTLHFHAGGRTSWWIQPPGD